MAIFITTWHHVRRSPYQALAAILIMILTFLTISLFAFLLFGSYQIVSYFETKPQVQIFFKDEAKKESIDAIKNQLQSSGKIASIKYISKEEALAIYKEQNKNDPLLLELVTADILPASIEISTYNVQDLAGVVDAVKNLPVVDKIGYQPDVIKKLTSWTDALRKAGVIIIVILAIESVLVMTTIIGIKISQKREEIEIMRLIGATNWYISWPFLYEGILYAVVGSLSGWAIANGLIWYYTPAIANSDFLKGIPVLPFDKMFLLELLGAEAGIAILLGIFSSFIAVYRYLE